MLVLPTMLEDWLNALGADPRGRRGASGAPPLGSAPVTSAPALKDLWRRGQHGWPASYPVVQLPNAPLLAAAGGAAVAALTNGSPPLFPAGAVFPIPPAWG